MTPRAVRILADVVAVAAPTPAARYAASQLALAFVLAAVGAVKGYQLLTNTICDAACDWAGLT